MTLPSFAEQRTIVLKVTPAQLISTKKAGNVEVGDIVRFKTVTDTYKDDKLFIKQDTIVSAYIGLIHENGFAGDSAQIILENFKTTDVDGKIVNIPIDYTITGNFTFSTQIKHAVNEILSQILLLPFIRGTEIYLVPERNIFNIVWNI